VEKEKNVLESWKDVKTKKSKRKEILEGEKNTK